MNPKPRLVCMSYICIREHQIRKIHADVRSVLHTIHKLADYKQARETRQHRVNETAGPVNHAERRGSKDAALRCMFQQAECE